MTINLIAVLDLDGSAFVEIDGRQFHIRPPYGSQHKVSVDQSDVKNAIIEFGFSAVDRQFSSWPSLIHHLNDLVRAAREDIREFDIKSRVLAVAPPEIITRYLDKIEQELLPKSQLEQAQSILLAMLKSHNVKEHADLIDRVVRLIEEVNDKMKANKSWQLRLQDSNFDSLQRSGLLEKAQTLTEQIVKQHSIWNFAG